VSYLDQHKPQWPVPPDLIHTPNRHKRQTKQQENISNQQDQQDLASLESQLQYIT
jgi:hypothetical protein